MNLPEQTEVLDEIEFFEREWTDRQVVELVILLYDFGVSLRKVARVLGWIGVDRSHVAVDPETRHLLHAVVAPSRNYLTTRRFLAELAELYERDPLIVVTDGATAPSSPHSAAPTSFADTV